MRRYPFVGERATMTAPLEHPQDNPQAMPPQDPSGLILPDPVETEQAVQQLRAAGFSDDQQAALTTALLRVLALWTQQATRGDVQAGLHAGEQRLTQHLDTLQEESPSRDHPAHGRRPHGVAGGGGTTGRPYAGDPHRVCPSMGRAAVAPDDAAWPHLRGGPPVSGLPRAGLVAGSAWPSACREARRLYEHVAALTGGGAVRSTPPPGVPHSLLLGEGTSAQEGTEMSIGGRSSAQTARA